jgi:hypothetical protein
MRMSSLAGRADNLTEMRNPALLRILPWTKEVFKEVVSRMQINSSTITAVCEAGTALFNRAHIVRTKDGIPAIGKWASQGCTLVDLRRLFVNCILLTTLSLQLPDSQLMGW